MKSYFQKDIVYAEDSVPSILTWVEPGSRVLEFGPAYGYMTRYMKETLHCRVVGIELNPEMAEHAGQFAEKVLVADIETDAWETQIEGPFDYILFADVLEHLRHPVRTLQRALPFGGCVLTSIPNIGYSAILLSLLDGEFNYQELGLLDNTHVHFFTRSSLHEMMSACGLACLDERNLVLPQPSRTELRKYYVSHPWAMWSILRSPDSAVYQFINKWTRHNPAAAPDRLCQQPRQTSVWQSLCIAARDLRYYVADHHPQLRNSWRKLKPSSSIGAAPCP
jgi:2-polyprenyl-3-methyl-5-hydroxy-6-metoxy-1,4-benzoquinol methylase